MPEALRGPSIRIMVNGATVPAHEGEVLAASLMAAGLLRLRDSPRVGGPRGAFCFLGVCQECVVRVDGVLQQSCLVPATDGMAVAL